MSGQTPYYLLLGDLRGSTRLTSQQADTVHQRLTDVLGKVNVEEAAMLVSPLEINYGDEFAGLFLESAPALRAILRIRHQLHGLTSFRYAVAYGRVGTFTSATRSMGGPVFKLANDSLETLKRQGRFAAWTISDDYTNQLMTTLAGIENTLIEAMTEYQYEVHVMSQSDLSQKEIAEHLGKFEQSVSSSLKRGNSDLTTQTTALMHQTLARLDASRTADSDRDGQ